MKPRRLFGVCLLGLALAGGATPAAAGPVDSLQAAHERHKQAIREAHQRHVRAIERAHARHMRHAPEPVRKLDRFVQERHRAHQRFLRGVERRLPR